MTVTSAGVTITAAGEFEWPCIVHVKVSLTSPQTQHCHLSSQLADLMLRERYTL